MATDDTINNEIKWLAYQALDGTEYNSAKLFITMFPGVTKVKDISANLSEGMHMLFRQIASELYQHNADSEEPSFYKSETASQYSDHATKLRTLAFKKRVIEEIKMLTQD